ncbi:GtrA family protein [Nocardia pseudovaccinii]|uniref:GtrA family protein n=1 Tax=Nocardia pseudovaccinii TaxID=189540 RepID=UPI0009FE1FC8|nr:GtrA family protein [Nocardia pseudovaccinii]
MDTCRWHAGGVTSTESLVAGFSRWCEAVVARLPLGLNRLVAPTFLGFALINGCTFGVDLALLTVLHGWLGLPVWLSVTMAYICAFGLSFVLNRTFNFHSHAPVGSQAVVYVVVVVINYLAFILGVGSGLTALGLEYHLSRLLAGACEAVYMYCAMRWVVFRGLPQDLDIAAVDHDDIVVGERPVRDALGPVAGGE